MHFHSRGITLMIWIIVFDVAVTVVLGLRLWAARIQKRAFRADDIMVLIAYIATLAMSGTTFWGIAHGMGDQTANLTPAELSVQFRMLFSAGITWLTGTVFSKLSMLALYTAIFSTRQFKWAAWAVMGLCGAYFCAFLPLFMTMCNPPSHSWAPVPGGSCRDVQIQEIASISANILVDTLIALLPMPLLWGLQMAKRNKIAITIMFGLGLCVVGVMAWRLQITLHPETQSDFVHGIRDVGLISFLEVWLSIIVVCIPTLAPLFAKYIRPAVSRVTRGSNRKSGPILREANNTIGGGRGGGSGNSSGGVHGFRGHHGKRELDSYLELESGEYRHTTEAIGGAGSTDDESLLKEPNSIRVRCDTHVYASPYHGSK
ncbi:hypothetical protein FQN57_003589 [Myotisia sp. PD_48]|nr:hypothetical protein FQN57_003589 [Myotisia sp. PD_48]